MLKRVLSLILALVLSLSISMPAFASDSNSEMNLKAEEFVSADLLQNTKAPKDVLSQVKEDMESLEKSNFFFEELQAVDFTDTGSVVYQMVTCGTIANITIEAEQDGTVVNIEEGSIHDTLKYCDDGRIILNGSEVVFNNFETNTGMPVVARIGAYDISDTPFSGTRASQYTIFKSRKYGNIDTDNLLVGLSLAAIKELLLYGLTLLGVPRSALTDEIIGVLYDGMTGNIKTNASRYAPNSTCIGYIHEKYEYNGSVALEVYNYRNIIDYYPDRVYEGEPVPSGRETVVFYEEIANF